MTHPASFPFLRFFFGLALCACIFFIAACKPASPRAANPTPSPTPAPTPDLPPSVKIGLLLPLSGSQSSFGSDAIQGAGLAIEQINSSGGLLGRRVELVTRDTRSEAGTTLLLATEFANDPSVPMVVGEITSLRTLEAARGLLESGKPLISPAATLPEVTTTGEYVFRVCYADPRQGQAMARLAGSLNVGRAAILAESDNPYSQSLAKSFRDAFTAGGGEIVAELKFSGSADSLQTALDSLRNAKPEVIFLPSYYEEAARVLQAARQADLDMPFLGGDGWDSTEFLAAAGPAADNCYLASHFSYEDGRSEAKSFIESYQARHGSPPPPLAALTYDAILLAAEAFRKAGSEDPQALCSALASIENFPGVTGSISLTYGRTPRKPVVILRVQDGAFQYLESIPPEPADSQ